MGAAEYQVDDSAKAAPGGDETLLLPGSPHAPTKAVDAAAEEPHGDGAETRKPRGRQRRASVQHWASARQSVSSSPNVVRDDSMEGRSRSRSRSLSADAAGSRIRPPPDAKITGPNQVAWECFKRIDADKSGLLDRDEVATLVKEMKIPGVSAAKLKKQLIEMDVKDPDGQISFREFSIWWNRHREVVRRRSRRDIKELFDLVDADGSGLLDKEELAQFVRKAQKFRSLKEVINNGEKPFDLDADWKLMQRGAPSGMEGVSFPMFEAWWKDRAGISHQDSVVLPEFISQRLTAGNGQIVHFHTGESRGDVEVDVDDSNWVPRTIWVGAIPRDHANKDTLVQAFAHIGPIQSVNVRVGWEKEDASGKNAKDAGKSWALISFRNNEDACKASKLGLKKGEDHYHAPRLIDDGYSVPYIVEMVKPDMMQSSQAQFIRTAQEIDVGNRGKALWMFLGSRLRSLINIQKVWGEVQSMYESRDASLYDAMPLPPLIRDPGSTSAAFWDVLQVILLCYLSVVLPLRSCFAVDVGVGTPIFWFETALDFIFVADLILNFRTAYMTPSGVLEERPRKIAQHYLKGWFLFDLLSCIPFRYVTHSGDQTNKAPKALRLVRLAKMLRLTRLKRIVGQHLGSRFGLVSELSGFVAIFLIITYVAHLLACFWYYVGTDNDTPATVEGNVNVQGWVQAEYCCTADETPPCAGTHCSSDDFAAVPVLQRYVTSLYYVFNALEAGTTQSERGFAVFAELCVGFIFGSLAGLMSAVMTSLRGNESEIASKLRQLQIWIEAKQLPKEQQSKIMEYFHSTWMTNKQINYGELVAEMPPSMANGVVTKLYARFLETIPLFTGLSHEVIVALCRELVPMIAVKEQNIMLEGSPGRELFMLMKGEVEMTKDNIRMGFLGEGAFFGEPAVLSGSETRTRTVTAVTRCELCFLTKSSMAMLRNQYPELDGRIMRFERAGVRMTREERKRLNDHLEGLRTRLAAAGKAGKLATLMQKQLDKEKREASSATPLLPDLPTSHSSSVSPGAPLSSPGVAAGGAAIAADPSLSVRLAKIEQDITLSKAETMERLDSVAADVSQTKAAIFALTASLQLQQGVSLQR